MKRPRHEYVKFNIMFLEVHDPEKISERNDNGVK